MIFLVHFLNIELNNGFFTLYFLELMHKQTKKYNLMKEMKNFFSPEFLNRIDDIIAFEPLKPTE